MTMAFYNAFICVGMVYACLTFSAVNSAPSEIDIAAKTQLYLKKQGVPQPDNPSDFEKDKDNDFRREICVNASNLDRNICCQLITGRDKEDMAIGGTTPTPVSECKNVLVRHDDPKSPDGIKYAFYTDAICVVIKPKLIGGKYQFECRQRAIPNRKNKKRPGSADLNLIL